MKESGSSSSVCNTEAKEKDKRIQTAEGWKRELEREKAKKAAKKPAKK